MRYTLTAIIMFLVIPAFITRGAETDDSWKTFASKAGGFSVLLPGTPSFSSSTDHTVVGEVVENLYSLKTEAASFSAEFSDLPGVAVFFASDDTIYKDAREGLLKQTGARELKYYSIEQEGIRGKEIVYEVPAPKNSPALRGKARFLLNTDFHRPFKRHLLRRPNNLQRLIPQPWNSNFFVQFFYA